MKSKHKILLRVVLFGVVFLLLFSMLNSFFQPVWLEWNNYYTVNGFYEEPEDTIETVFLGASIMSSGITPTRLYDKYGICAYNLAMAQQTIFTSYYWLEETYRLHSETLKTVVVDMSGMRSGTGESFYHKAFDEMKLSEVKLRALYDYTDGDYEKMFSFMLPILSYHDRWSSLEETDYEKHTYDPDNGTRGYYQIKRIYANRTSLGEPKIKNIVVDESAEHAKLREDSKEYLKKMADFCEEKGIRLVLIKTPANNWSSSLHNAVDAVADELGLEFFDFNFSPYYEQTGYVHAFDSNDGTHMNYYGAAKLTDWFGKFLTEECGATDVRGNEKYAHMEKQVAEYNDRVIQSINLLEAEDVSEYLKVALSSDNAVLITVKNDAAKMLTDEQKKYFESIGLEKLVQLNYGDSYLAVIDSGNVLHEEVKILEDSEDEEAITYSGSFKDNTFYSISSGGKEHGDLASCLIDGKEQAKNSRGLNITVYSNTLGEVVDSVCFDTSTKTGRECYSLEMFEKSAAETFASHSVYKRVLEYQQSVDQLKNEQLQNNQ